MQVRKMLEETQPIIMQTLARSFKEGKTSHAYLVSGQKGTPTKELAFFLAQSFVCDNRKDNLACEECLSCVRLQDGTYSDFIFVDGSSDKIDKNALEDIESRLSRVSLESSGYKIYIIHLFENVASTKAANLLLKFLEEPSEKVVAILTTENISAILPTIVSRCQVLNLKPLDKKELAKKLIEKGINKDDALILAERYNKEEEILSIYEDPFYLQTKELVIKTLNILANNIKGINFFVMNELEPFIENKEIEPASKMNLYLDLLGIVLQDVIKFSLKQDVTFKTQKEDIEKLSKYQKVLPEIIEDIMLSKSKLNRHVNASLILDNIFYKLRKEVSDYAKL